MNGMCSLTFTIAALISLKIGLMSLEQIKKIVPNALKQYQLLLIIGLFYYI